MAVRRLQMNITVGLPSMEFTSQTSVTHRGVTFAFTEPGTSTPKAIPAGQGAEIIPGDGGQLFALSTEAFDIYQITPASAVEDGIQAHGAMSQPWVEVYGSQGFIDNSAAESPYSAGLNIDPAVSGAYSVAQGATDNIVKGIKRAGATGYYNSFDDWVTLTILPVAPKQNLLRPAMSNVGQKQFSADEIDLSVLRNLAAPAGLLSYATALTYQRGGYPFWSALMGDNHRIYGCEADLVSSGYSADLAWYRASLLYLLQSDALSAAQKQAAAQIVCQHGLDVWGMYQNGHIAKSGAGQHHGEHTFLFFAAFLLQDADMLAAAHAYQSNMRGLHSWESAEDVGRIAAFPNGSGQKHWNARTTFASDVGKPMGRGSTNGSSPFERYNTVAGPAGADELFPILLLQSGPGGVSGVDAFLDGPDDETNKYAADIHFRERLATWRDKERSLDQYNLGYDECYDDWRSTLNGILPRRTFSPDEMKPWSYTPGVAYQGFTTGVDGGFSWDISGLDYATEAITDRWVRYSLDGVQWFESNGHSDTGSITGLLRGVGHYVQIAKESASGKGTYSQNFPMSGGNDFDYGERNVPVTTGAEANSAPAFTVNPQIHHQTYPAWQGPSWTPTSGAVPDGALVLACGVGYFSGYPAPQPGDISFQWKRDGVDISGEIGQFAAIDYATDPETAFSCEVSATTSEGTVSYTTPAVTIPAISPPPAGTIIDTDFGPDFAWTYGAVKDSMFTQGNHNPEHLPFETFAGGFTPDGLEPGGIQADLAATSAYPFIALVLTGLTPEQDYEIDISYLVHSETQAGAATTLVWGTVPGNHDVRLGTTPSGTDVASYPIAQGDGTPREDNQVQTFTMPAGETTLYVGVYVATNTGNKGRPIITNLTVQEV